MMVSLKLVYALADIGDLFVMIEATKWYPVCDSYYLCARNPQVYKQSFP